MIREAMNFAQKMTNERTQEATKQTNPPCLKPSFYIILIVLSYIGHFTNLSKTEIFIFFFL